MKTSSYRARVMNFAHHIRRTTSATMADAMKKAWQLYKLAKMMRNGTVKFFYEKVDGSARVAYGTLRDLPSGVTANRNARKAPNCGTMCYWDTKKQAFRCFRVENFIAMAL